MVEEQIELLSVSWNGSLQQMRAALAFGRSPGLDQSLQVPSLPQSGAEPPSARAGLRCLAWIRAATVLYRRQGEFAGD
jgi:hypothetical protein